MVVFNLQDFMTLQRPIGSSAVGSRLTTPSGSVPGDGEVDCTAMHTCGEDGAGLDWFLCLSFEIFYAICKGLRLIFHFLESL
jgi:hypothetical protein